jgi:hypothetical protein
MFQEHLSLEGRLAIKTISFRFGHHYYSISYDPRLEINDSSSANDVSILRVLMVIKLLFIIITKVISSSLSNYGI